MGDKNVEFDKLTAALVDAGRQTFLHAIEQHPNESFYCFAFYTNDVATYIEATMSGENGLRQAAKSYSAASGTIDEHMSSLRWSPCDSPYHTLGEGHFDAVHKILLGRSDPYEIEDDGEAAREISFRFEAAFRALQILDEEGVFGTGSAREKILLNVLQGDQTDRNRLENGMRVNPSVMLEMLRVEFPVPTTSAGYRALGSFSSQHMAEVRASSDGKILAACGVGGELLVWDLEKDKGLLEGNTRGSHWNLVISGNGRLVVIGDKRKVFGISLPEGTRNSFVIEHSEKVCGLGMSGNGKVVVSSAWDESLKATEVESGKVLWEINLLAKQIYFSPNEERLLVAGAGLNLLDPETGVIEQELEPSANGFFHATWSRNGMLAVGHTLPGDEDPPPIYVCDPDSIATRITLAPVPVDGHRPYLGALAFSPDGRVLACADGSRLHFWVLNHLKYLGWLQGKQDICSVVFLSDRQVATCGRDWDLGPPVYLWNLDEVDLQNAPED